MDHKAKDEFWMGRCFDLAGRGIGQVSPNPPVGAILVHKDRVIGEGYHTKFGAPHAEVEAVRSVADADRPLIPEAILYVTLEPCCVTGKTPPCTNLILSEGIRDVRISTLDPNPEVAGNGVAILRKAGVSVISGIRETEGKALIRSFKVNILQKRPYVILKWAQSKFGIMGIEDQQVWLSNPETRIWSHDQRSQVDAILVGARTVRTDNPSLTVREYPGRSPHRVIFDPNARLDQQFNVFNKDGRKVFYYSLIPNDHLAGDHIEKYLLEQDDIPGQITGKLFQQGIGILLVEGGAFMHKLFIEAGLWDEAWVIKTQHPLDKGIAAPNVKGTLLDKLEMGTDTIAGIKK